MGFGIGLCGCRCTTTPPASCGTLCLSSTGCTLRTILPGVGVTLSYRPIASVAVAGGGGGYTVPPTVSFSGGAGSGTVAVAVLTGGVVTGINVTTGGAWTVAPTAVLSGGVGGSGASAGAVTLGSSVTVGTGTTTGQVTTIARANAGSGYTSVPSVAIGGEGTGATAVATISGPIASVRVDNAGGGYTTAPNLALAPANGGATLRVLLTPSTLASVTPTAGGVYSTGAAIPTVTLTTPTGYTGGGATASARMGLNAAFVGTSGGTGYTVGDVLTVAGGTATTAATVTVTAIGAGGVVSGLAVANAGAYSVEPAAPIGTTGGTGTGCTLSVNWKVTAVVVTAAGSSYTTAPAVAFSSGSATATAALVPTTIASVAVVTGGAYVAPPTIALSGGGGGSGGALTAVIPAYSVGGFTVTNVGSGYAQGTTTVTVSGGGGSGAAGNATVVVRWCFAIPTAGNYSYAATAPAGSHYANNSGTVTATCSNTVNLDLGAAPGYTCNHAGCCPPGEDPAPPFVQTYPPATIMLNDGIGSVALTSSNPTSTSAVWSGCASRPASSMAPDCNDPFTFAPGNVTVYFQASCLSAGTLFFSASVGGCGTGSNCTGNPPADTMQCSGVPTGTHCPTTISGSVPISCAGGSLSGSFATSGLTSGGGGAGFFYIYGSGTTFALSG
jgi:hypothetical protein